MDEDRVSAARKTLLMWAGTGYVGHPRDLLMLAEEAGFQSVDEAQEWLRGRPEWPRGRPAPGPKDSRC